MSETVFASLDAPESEAGGGQSEAPPDQGAVPQAPRTGDAGQRAEAPADAGKKPGSDAQPPAPGAADAGKDKLVPLAALHEAREQARQLKTQIAELEKRKYLSDEDAELLTELKAKRAEAQRPKVPEFIEDPKGYIDHKEQEVRDALKELRESNTKRAEAEEQQRQMQTLFSTISTHEQAFVASNPDYNDALAHVRNVRTQQLKMMFPDATDQQIQHQIGREEIGGAQQILARGGNPAEFAYNYAKTLGYMKKAPASAANGAAHVEPEPEPKPDKDAMRTLGGGGGAEQDDAPSDPMPEFTAALKERFTRKRK